MEKTFTLTIPARQNAPTTSLYVKIVAHDAECLHTKPYVFMLPGGPGYNHSHYQDYACLADHYNVVFHDPRGCGLSGKENPDSCTMDNYIQDVDYIRQHLELNTIAIVGKSYGAMCALYYAIEYPQHVTRLVLAAGAANHEFIATAKQNFTARDTTDEQKAFFDKLMHGTFTSDDDLMQYGKAIMPLYSYKVRHHEAVERPIPKYPIAHQPINLGMRTFLKTFDLTDRLTDVACPTLILVGDEDWATDKCHSERLAAEIKNAHYICYPQADHSLESDVPALYFNDIQQFLTLPNALTSKHLFFKKIETIVDDSQSVVKQLSC